MDQIKTTPHAETDASIRPVTRLRARPFVLAAAALTTVAGVLAGGIYWQESSSYPPPRFAGHYGPQPGRPDNVASGNSGIDGYKLIGNRGTTQKFRMGLINDGDHEVTITRADFTSAQIFGHTRVLDQLTWSPYRADPARLVNGLPEPSRSFPAELPAHGQINIRLRVTKPARASVPVGGFVAVSEQIRLHWTAMFSSLTADVGPDGSIALCG